MAVYVVVFSEIVETKRNMNQKVIMAIPRLRDIRVSFRTSGMKISIRYSDQGELASAGMTRSGMRVCAGIM